MMSAFELRKLDDKMVHLKQLEDARQLGRIEGENRGWAMLLYFRGEGEKPEEFKRTEHKRLEKNIYKKFKKLQRRA